jgi:hypothetical protein
MIDAFLMGSYLLSQKINPINLRSIRIGRNIRVKANFNTRLIPTVIDATKKNIPRINITGTRRMPNISLRITSDIGYLGVSITTDTQVKIKGQILHDCSLKEN